MSRIKEQNGDSIFSRFMAAFKAKGKNKSQKDGSDLQKDLDIQNDNNYSEIDKHSISLYDLVDKVFKNKKNFMYQDDEKDKE